MYALCPSNTYTPPPLVCVCVCVRVRASVYVCDRTVKSDRADETCHWKYLVEVTRLVCLRFAHRARGSEESPHCKLYVPRLKSRYKNHSEMRVSA